MTLRPILLTAIFVVSSIAPIRFASAVDLIYGHWARPACGKVCKLVCGTEPLVSTCYACECAEICVPPPSRPGRKHCATCCDCEPKDADGQCCPQRCCEKGPKCEFCWRDWVACGCARPRTVKVLTKYQAEKEICWYHWEVVDTAECDCVPDDEQTAAKGSPGPRNNIYKPAPPDAAVGDALPLSDEERDHVTSFLAMGDGDAAGDAGRLKLAATEQTANPSTTKTEEPAAGSIWLRIRRQFSAAK